MSSFKRMLALMLSISLISLSFSNVQAAMISNDQIIHKSQHVSDKEALLQAIKQAGVQEQLLSMGVTTADIEIRINQMTQEEIAQFNQRMDELPAGAGVLGIIVVLFIVFVITDAIGATDIFPFVHPVR